MQKVSTSIPYGYGSEIAMLVHPDIDDEIQTYHSKVQNETFVNSWMEMIHNPILKAVGIRRTLKNYSKEIK